MAQSCVVHPEMKSLLSANGPSLLKSEFPCSYEGLNIMQASCHQKIATEKQFKGKSYLNASFSTYSFLFP